jgi:beta-galactosidase
MLPQRVGKELAGYVRNGGALIAEARAGWNDERGLASERIPGMGLDEVFGCRETAVQSAPARKTRIRWEDGSEFNGLIFEEALEPMPGPARIVARFPNGTAAAVSSTYGKGKTLALGAYVSAAYERERAPAQRKFFEGLLVWAGVEAPLTVTGEAEVRLLETGKTKMLFAFNHSDKPAQVSLHFAQDYKVTDLASGRPAQLSGTISPKGVWVLRLD